MLKVIIWTLCLFLTVQAYDFKVTVKWDEMAMTGEAEAILQYYHDGKVEAIRGNLDKPSSDGNVTVNRTLTGGSQEFIIHDAKGALFNIWVINDLMDEEFAEEEDFYTLSNAGIEVWVEDRLNGGVHSIKLKPGQKGLVYRAGVISDGHFYEVNELFLKKRLYVVNLVDAVNGGPLAGVGVTIKNQRTGETVALGQTDANGTFISEMEYGSYDVLFSKQGYLEAKHQFEMTIMELPVSMHFALTPQVREFRIVLTWGAFPPDLDAHLSGPRPGGGTFHIWWRNKTPIGGRNFLDRDDQHSYGPETITIYKPAPGVYTYAVHNYSGRMQRGSRDLSYSGAHVDVYADGRLVASFDAPRGVKGNVWKVFQIDRNNQVAPINQFYDQKESAQVLNP